MSMFDFILSRLLKQFITLQFNRYLKVQNIKIKYEIRKNFLRFPISFQGQRYTELIWVNFTWYFNLKFKPQQFFFFWTSKLKVFESQISVLLPSHEEKCLKLFHVNILTQK